MRNVTDLLLLLAFAKAGAIACSCVNYPTLCERLGKADVAFVGLVTQGTEDEAITGSRGGFGERPAVVSVETIIRGLPEGTRALVENLLERLGPRRPQQGLGGVRA